MTEPDLATAEQHLRHVGSKPMGLIVGALAQVVLAEYDRRADRDQLHAALTELTADHERRGTQLQVTMDALARVDHEADQLCAALTELRAASRGLAFFDQIKCARWNAAYQQASRVLGLEDET